MEQYHALMQRILDHGVRRDDRTGVGTLAVFGERLRFDLSQGFPLLTTKKVFWKGVVHELLWFLQGESNLRYLHRHGIRIWDAWADQDRSLGPIYGVQWRSWPRPDGGTIDQLAQVISGIRDNPASRRLLVSAWNVAELDKMQLPPCHVMFQFFVADGRLSCQLYQRSADVFLGLPFNIASYSLLTHLVAQVTGLQPGEFVHVLGDTHLYLNHLEQVLTQLARTPRTLPSLAVSPDFPSLDAVTQADIHLHGYDPHPAIEAPIAV